MKRPVVIDTNILIDHLNGIAEAGIELAYHPDAAIGTITWMEVMTSFEAKLLAKLTPQSVVDATQLFLRRFRLVDVDMAVMIETTRIRALALFQHRKLALPDAIIKATANVTGCVLVTRNTKDFDGPDIRVPYMVEVRSVTSKASTLFTPQDKLVVAVTYIAFPPA